MFDFVGVFIQKISLTIGASLIALGSLIGGVQAPLESVLTDESAMQEEVVQETGSEEVIDEVVTPISINNTNFTDTKITPPEVSNEATLQIQDVKSVVGGNNVVVTWKTTIPAESRLIFDNGEGRVFESNKGSGVEHEIRAGALEESVEYDIKITATTKDKSQYDDYFDLIYAPKKYTAYLGDRDDDCQMIMITDTASNIAAYKKVTLRPSVTGGKVNILRPKMSLTSNSDGEIEYCGGADTFKITGENFVEVTLYSYFW